MTTLQQFRQQTGTDYDDLSDDELASRLHRKFYPDLDKREFRKQIGLGPEVLKGSAGPVIGSAQGDVGGSGGMPSGPYPTDLGLVEPLLTIGSGMLAEPAAGLAGIYGTVFGEEEGAGADLVQKTREWLTYQPRTETGKAGLQAVADVAEPVTKFFTSAEDLLGDVGFELAGPTGGALGKTLPTAALELLGLGGIRKLRGVKKVEGISDKFNDALEASGRKVDDLTDEEIGVLQSAQIKQAVEVAKRKGVFDDLGVPTLKSRLTQKQTDFLTERTLNRKGDPDADSPAGIIQTQLALESEGLADAAKRIMDETGIPAEAGEAIKEALYHRLRAREKTVGEAYRYLDFVSGGNSIPLTGNVTLASLDNITHLTGRLTKPERKQLDDLFIEYGLDSDPERVADWVEVRELENAGPIKVKTEVTPLTLNNAEEMRQGLNSLMSFDNSDNMQKVARRIKAGLDDELDGVDKYMRWKNIDPGIVSAAKRARDVAHRMKTEYSPKGLVGKLTSKEKGTFDRELIVNSEVTKRILGKGKEGTIESVEAVMDSLEKAGKKGEVAIANLQATVMMDLMNEATRALSNKLRWGVRGWSGTGFERKMISLGDDKLGRIFKNNPEGLQDIYTLREAGRLKTAPAAVAKSSGTADDLINFMQQSLERVVTLGAGYSGFFVTRLFPKLMKWMWNGDMKNARKAINTDRVVRQQFNQARYEYSQLFTALGMTGLPTKENRKDWGR